MEQLSAPRDGAPTMAAASMPSFALFEPTTALWKDYQARFDTFAGANSTSEGKMAQVFLTNQTVTTYKLLETLASQQAMPKSVNDLTMKDIQRFMDEQYNARRFVIQERYNFWLINKYQPGETVHELAARIRQAATTCDFPSIKDIQDEAM